MYEILAEFKFGGGTSHFIMYVIINVAHDYVFIREHLVLSVLVLEQSREFTNLQKIQLAAC